jgi:hypothetical protein
MMSDEIINSEVATENNDSDALGRRDERFMDRIADKAARRAEETERKYDSEHGIFTE